MSDQSEFLDLEDDVEEFEVKGIRNALLRYRVMAYIVGTLLVLLCFVAMPLKYFGPKNPAFVTLTAVPHGWLFMVLILTVIDLGRRVHWSVQHMLLIIVTGLLPFVTFYAEHRAAGEVKQLIADVEAGRARLPID